jgi:hypothetical protein
MIGSTIINIIFKYSRSISNSLIMPPIATRSRLQVVSMVTERERDGDDNGDGGGGAVPYPWIKWISECDSFGGVSLFVAALLRIIYWCLHESCLG